MSKSRVRVLIIVIIVIVALAAWSPWITRDYAENKVLKSFNDQWVNTDDGCGFNCDGCDVVVSQKVAFGYYIELKYGCGTQIFGQLVNFEYSTYFVTFLGTIYELINK